MSSLKNKKQVDLVVNCQSQLLAVSGVAGLEILLPLGKSSTVSIGTNINFLSFELFYACTT